MMRSLKWAAAFLVAVSAATAAEKPNFLVILCDDLGYADTGFTGSKEIFTPRLDQLAENGMVCENGYVTHPY